MIFFVPSFSFLLLTFTNHLLSFFAFFLVNTSPHTFTITITITIAILSFQEGIQILVDLPSHSSTAFKHFTIHPPLYCPLVVPA